METKISLSIKIKDGYRLTPKRGIQSFGSGTFKMMGAASHPLDPDPVKLFLLLF